MDPFLLETIRNPFSAPFLIIVHLVLATFVISKLKIEVFNDYIKRLKSITISQRYRSLTLILISIIIFLSSSFFIFYNMTKIPAAGFVDDDALIVVTAYLLKNLGHDSYENKIPYYPYLNIKYHHEIVGGGAPMGLPVYLQAFIQYFMAPGHLSLRFECTLLMFLTSLVLIFIFFLLTENIHASILCGALFNLLPWTRILARITPQTTIYCFASACFLFGFLYLLKSNGKILGIIFYIISLAILFLSYTPGLLLAPICAVLMPFILLKHSGDYKQLSQKLIVLGLLFLGILYFEFQDEQSYKWNLARAQYAQGLEGLANLDFSLVFKNLLNKANIYLANYLGYLLPQFLFFTGDSNPRHNTGFGGQLFASLCIAFYFGLFKLVERRKKSLPLKFLLVYLLISIIPAAICLEGGLETSTQLPLHALRSSCILPPITLVVALGLYEIFKRTKPLFFIYLIVISININNFYFDYFRGYMERLSNSWIAEPGLAQTSQKAFEIIKKKPETKLFYSCALSNIAYYNLDKIGIKALVNGNGLLSNVYHYYNRGNIEPQNGDLFVVQEPFDYPLLKDTKFEYILRVKNPYFRNGDFGASLFKVVE